MVINTYLCCTQNGAMDFQDFYINSYLKVEENLKALGYRFLSLKSFFEFTERNLTTIIYQDYIDVYLGYTDEENKGYFVCRIEIPKKP